MLLEELRRFDNQVYGVAHGLLNGCRGTLWVHAQSLFDDLKQMDSSTASAFYNALTDMLWHFGQVLAKYHVYSLQCIFAILNMLITVIKIFEKNISCYLLVKSMLVTYILIKNYIILICS